MIVNCPSCGKAGNMPDNASGRRATCPKCGHKFVVSEPVPEAAPISEKQPEPPSTKTYEREQSALKAASVFGAKGFFGSMAAGYAIDKLSDLATMRWLQKVVVEHKGTPLEVHAAALLRHFFPEDKKDSST